MCNTTWNRRRSKLFTNIWCHRPLENDYGTVRDHTDYRVAMSDEDTSLPRLSIDVLVVRGLRYPRINLSSVREAIAVAAPAKLSPASVIAV